MAMDRTLDEYLRNVGAKKEQRRENGKKRRMRDTQLDGFLPREHIDFFRELRIGSKRIRNKFKDVE